MDVRRKDVRHGYRGAARPMDLGNAPLVRRPFALRGERRRGMLCSERRPPFRFQLRLERDRIERADDIAGDALLVLDDECRLRTQTA